MMQVAQKRESRTGEHVVRLTIVASLVGTTIMSVTGCGGSPTQAEMMRNAIRRPKDDEDEDDLPAAETKPTTTIEQGRVAPEDSDSSSHDEVVDGPGSGANPATRVTSSVAQDMPDKPLGERPDKPLTLIERRQRTIDNMTAISAAMQSHVTDNKGFPPSAIVDVGKTPLLSWRVALLPRLGYQELYSKFHLEEPWNSPHNLKLLESMPSEYQSPERFDTKTNYCVPTGSFTAFSSERGQSLRRIEDGVHNTVVLLEVDDKLAVPWTAPQDYAVNLKKPLVGLGTLREDGVFVAWGSGMIGRVRTDTSAPYLRAMYTIDAGERFAATQISQFISADPAQKPVVATNDTSLPAGPATTPDPSTVARDTNLDIPLENERRHPEPTSAEQKKSLTLFREIYLKDYELARTPDEKKDFAKKLMSQANGLREDLPGRYVLLSIVSKIASEAGDMVSALSAVDLMIEEYDIDGFDLKLAVLLRRANGSEKLSGDDIVYEEAARLIERAIDKDDFSAAAKLQRVALAAARRLNDKPLIRKIVSRGKQIEYAQRTNKRVTEAFKILADDPENEEANLIIGKYYCLIKGQWQKGLPMLAQGSDADLGAVAKMELQNPLSPESQTDVADVWWNLATSDSINRDAILRRAAHWYSLAIPRLAGGLARVKAERRLQEVERLGS